MTLKSRPFSISLASLFILSGCAVINNRGHEVDPAQIEKIHVGQTTKEEVATLLGTPSSVGTFGNQTGFYMSDTTNPCVFSPQIFEKQYHSN